MASAGFVFSDEPQLQLQAGIRVIIGQSAHLFVSHQIDTRITHMTDGEFFVAKHTYRQSCPHASTARIFHSRFIDGEISALKNLFQQLLGRDPRIGILKDRQRNIYRHFTGDVAIAHSSKSVGYDRDSSLAAAHRFIARFPVSERVLVFLAFRSPRGFCEVAKSHCRKEYYAEREKEGERSDS